MKKNELKALLKSGEKAVMTKIRELKLAVIESKLKSGSSQSKNTSERKNMKRTIARLMTQIATLKEAK